MRRCIRKGTSITRHNTSSSSIRWPVGLCFSTDSGFSKDDPTISFKNHGPISQQPATSIRHDVESKIRTMIQSIKSNECSTNRREQIRRSNEIHTLMRSWVSLQFELTPSNLNGLGKIIEELLDVVLISYERKSSEAHVNMPTILMYKYAIEACILPISSLSKTNEHQDLARHAIHRAENIFHRLLDFVQRQCDNDINEKEVHKILLGPNRNFLDQTIDVSSIINSCASLLIHTLLKVNGNKTYINKAELIVKRMNGLHRFSALGWKGNTTFNNALINVLIGQGESKSIAQAEHILQKMISEMDSKSFGPNLLSFHLVLRGFAKRGNVKAAEELLDTFQSLSNKNIINFEPDATTYNIILDAYAKSGDRYDCEKARQMLVWMMEEGNRKNNSTLLPDIVSYTVVINALSKRGMAKEAHNLLVQVVESLEGGKSDVVPDNFVFSAVVDAW